MFKSKKKSEIPAVQDSRPLNGSRSSYDNRADLLGASTASRQRTPSPQPPSRGSSGYSQLGYPAQGGYQPQGGYANYANNYDRNRADLFKNAKPPRESFGRGDLDDPDRYGRNGDDGQQQQALDEDDEVEAIKQQIRFTKQESLASTRNALRTAREAEETARGTLMRLGDQSERIASTERAIDMTKAHNDRAEDEAKEIKALNRSIFRPNFNINKKAKRDAAEQRIVDRHNAERDQREEVRRGVLESRERVGGAFRDLDRQQERSAAKKAQPQYGSSRIQDRARYTFEADEEDEGVEQELEDNLGEIGDLSKRLNLLARAAGDEVRSQNQKLGQLTDKVDSVDSQMARNTDRLHRLAR